MGDEDQPNNNGLNSQRTESVRPRWTPKPEQISILENIFNSGTFNPQKEETKHIRKLLEKYGAVGDASIFYWFQNRRSRYSRLQRRIKAQLSINNNNNPEEENNCFFGFTPPPAPVTMSSSATLIGSSSSSSGIDHEGGGTDENLTYLASFCQQQQIQGNSFFSPLEIDQYGIITVFINGVATEVQRGPLDVRAMFGDDLMLFHSLGLPITVNDYGILLEPLQHGQSYFLVPRNT